MNVVKNRFWLAASAVTVVVAGISPGAAGATPAR